LTFFFHPDLCLDLVCISLELRQWRGTTPDAASLGKQGFLLLFGLETHFTYYFFCLHLVGIFFLRHPNFSDGTTLILQRAL
jgi:hypothetical protein